jgi:tetratricopeptide (TPR) repeat protein
MSSRRHPHDARSSNRSEPTLGDLDHVEGAPRAPAVDGLPRVTVERRQARGVRVAGSRGRRGWLLPVLVLLVVALGAALWFNQNRLRGMVPRTDLNSVLAQAQQALDAGNLDGEDGTSARELFQQVAASEPDNDRARAGLRQVGQAELSLADAALQAGQLEEATRRAAVARELLGGGRDVDRLDALIRQAQAGQVHTADVVDQARQALADGKLEGPDGAGALYQRVLRADPGNAVAAHGLDQVANALAVQAHDALEAGDLAKADPLVLQIAALRPNNGSLPALRALQAQRRQQQDGAVKKAIDQGREALRDGRIAGPGDDTALARFKAALALDPDSNEAKAGLGDVAQALTVQANAAMDVGDREQAARLLEQASALAPKSADLAAAHARLQSKPSVTRPPADKPPATHPPAHEPAVAEQAGGEQPVVAATLSPQQSAAVAQLLQRAQQATASGNIMMPPGDSAYDLYRSALAIDGNDVLARQGLQALPGKVEQLFRQALAGGQLKQADDMLANLAELAPGDPAQGALRNQLASAWVDRAQQQLDGGDRIGASQSLARARKLAPNHPRVTDLAARLQGTP